MGQQGAVVSIRIMRMLTLASGLLYTCRPEPWFLWTKIQQKLKPIVRYGKKEKT